MSSFRGSSQMIANPMPMKLDNLKATMEREITDMCVQLEAAQNFYCAKFGAYFNPTAKTVSNTGTPPSTNQAAPTQEMLQHVAYQLASATIATASNPMTPVVYSPMISASTSPSFPPASYYNYEPVASSPSPIVSTPTPAPVISPSPAPIKEAVKEEDKKAWADRIFKVLDSEDHPFNLADLGQKEWAPRPDSCKDIRLKDLIKSDERFFFNDENMVALSSWKEMASSISEVSEIKKDELNEAFEEEEEEQAPAEEEGQKVYEGTVYIKADEHLYLRFNAAKFPELFDDQVKWLEDQQKQNFKKGITAYYTSGNVKFGQNLIAFRNKSDPQVFDSFRVGQKVLFYVQKKGLNSYATELIKA